jgi:glutamate/tyrosine decarboxylase-like PLP-dependent enzyme
MNPDIFSNYIGPKGENIHLLQSLIDGLLKQHAAWRDSFFTDDASLYPQNLETDGALKKELDLLIAKSMQGIPTFHPRYSAQMTKDTTIPAILGQMVFLLTNPNNHAYEGGPITTLLEVEVTDMLLKMCGFHEGWGHLTSGGSLANTEALWAIRDYYDNSNTVYFSSVCHYSWKRICKILNIQNYCEVPADGKFHIDLNVLEDKLKVQPALAVIANIGSTGTGSIDDIEGLLQLKNKYGFHLHVDAAYGGFFRSVILDEDSKVIAHTSDSALSEYAHRQLQALQYADSVTIDPHKQGLISYGAGAVLYKHEGLRQVILNTAPYTYHITDKPNIGMYSLEGSRPGAMAAACYLTYKVLPLHKNGLGEFLAMSLCASKYFHHSLEKHSRLRNAHEPDLDLNCFYIEPEEKDISSLNAKTQPVYHKLSLESENPPFILSKFVMPPELGARVFPDYTNGNNEDVLLLRSVFMKHWNAMDDFRYIKELVRAIEILL